ncbi:hypothetical protein IVA93_06415 [Bradyrhizobium sp. 155]|uniref:hypothetical protein n=1 Tax=Bradyrhizobium sp. 155 TaxID=2782629 RepID=UPI001FFEBD61|nr:hypothetical protein [Bradyrhizobium sp. 155]UPK12837.1 hypothetical protein IVA93_06415 [Bradyrhizobium sp. 155]
MFCLTPIPPHQFDVLIGKTEHNRKAMKKRGQLQPLIVPSPEQRADGLWRDQIFIAADAVIVSALDLLVDAGAARAAVDHAMRDLEFEIISRLNDLDDGKPVQLCFAHDGKHWVVLSAGTVIDAMQAVAQHFKNGAGAEPPKVSFYCIRLHDALATVRARAAQHEIDFPDRIWPTPEELDAGAGLLAAAIAPRISPVIEKWQTMRQRDAFDRRFKLERRDLVDEPVGAGLLGQESALVPNSRQAKAF